jgi:hypothetical protein
MASIPERVSSLERAVASLAPQADRICVALNGYTEWPEFLDAYTHVHATVMPAGANGGDAEKFAGVDDWDGYVATCDDDLLYPPNYIPTLKAGIERHGRRTIVGFHGGKTLGFTGAAMAATHKQIRCLGDLARDDVDVNVLGTGALGFHTAGVPLWRDVFRHPNMADVHLACHARYFGIPMVALAHRRGWLKDICPPGPTIYESNKRRDGTERDTHEQREIAMSRFDWGTTPARPCVRVSIATCDRPELLDDLLADLEKKAGWLDIHVAVYDDYSRADYSAARARVSAHGWSWHRFPRRLGKDGHWQLINKELADCRDAEADWFVFLPDDVRMVKHALARAIDTWTRLDDPATLTLWRLKDHEGQPNWTGRLPVDAGEGFEVFHVDGIYLCRRDTLEFLDYACPRPTTVRRRPTSSGVGRAMSLHLHAAGKRMYRVNRSLAMPVPNVPSVMNPEAADRRYQWVAL